MTASYLMDLPVVFDFSRGENEMKIRHSAVIVMIMFCMVCSLSAQAQTKDAGAKRYKMSGVVKAVDSKGHALTVQHGDIPGFMGAMTMSYPAGKTEDIQKIAAGDQIQADVVVTGNEMHLEGIKVTPAKK
jgi:Cu/Ag efflux protein CusF